MYNWIETTFNVSGGVTQAIAVILALAVVLLLFGLFIFILKRLMGAQTPQSRSRQPRIAVMDSATVDARRRLVLVRRDNIEHLILIGGPSDVVVEQNIIRNAPIAAQRPGQPAGLGGPAPVRGPMAPGPDIPVRPEDLAAQNDTAPSPAQQARTPALAGPAPQAAAAIARDTRPTPAGAETAAAPPPVKQRAEPHPQVGPAFESASANAAGDADAPKAATRSSSRASDLLKAAAQNGFSRHQPKEPVAEEKAPDVQSAAPAADTAPVVQPAAKPSAPAPSSSAGKASAALKSLTRPFSPRERPSYGNHSISPPASGPAARAKTALLKPREDARQPDKVEPVIAAASASTAVPAAAAETPDSEATSVANPAPPEAAPEQDTATATAPETAAAPVRSDTGPAAATVLPESTASAPPPVTSAEEIADAAPSDPAQDSQKETSEADPKPDITLDMNDLLEDIPQDAPAATGAEQAETAPTDATAETQEQKQEQEPAQADGSSQQQTVAPPVQNRPPDQTKPTERVKAAPRPTTGLGDKNPIEDEMAKILDELGGQPN